MVLDQINVFTDGGSRGNPGPAAIGVLIETTSKKTLLQYGQTIGETTNNIAEYEAFSYSLNWLCKQTIPHATLIVWHLDSLLVVNQLNGLWRVKDKKLLPIYQKIVSLLKKSGFKYRICHIPREQNAGADAMVNRALDRDGF